jgi:hypothetical protein
MGACHSKGKRGIKRQAEVALTPPAGRDCAADAEAARAHCEQLAVQPAQPAQAARAHCEQLAAQPAQPAQAARAHSDQRAAQHAPEEAAQAEAAQEAARELSAQLAAQSAQEEAAKAVASQAVASQAVAAQTEAAHAKAAKEAALAARLAQAVAAQATAAQEAARAPSAQLAAQVAACAHSAQLAALVREHSTQMAAARAHFDQLTAARVQAEAARLAALNGEHAAALRAVCGSPNSAQHNFYLRQGLASRLSIALHALDTAQGKVSGLALYEASLHTILCNRHLDAIAGRDAPPSAWQARLLDGTSCRALVAYLQVAARDNEAASVLAQARSLHALLCQQARGGGALDRGGLIAFAAILCFSGRDPSLYARLQGAATPVTLRAVSYLPPDSEADMLLVSVNPVLQVYAGILAGGGSGREEVRMQEGGGGAAACAVTATTSSG